MLDARGRDIGEPTGEIIHKPTTPEQYGRAWANIIHTFEDTHSRHYGFPIQMEVLWEESSRLDEILHTQGAAAREVAVKELKKQIGA